MFGLLFDQIWVSIFTAIIMFVTWFAYQYLGRKTAVSRLKMETIKQKPMKRIAETSTPKCGCKEIVFELMQAIKRKLLRKIVEILQRQLVTTTYAQTETMTFTERLTNYGDKVVDQRKKFDKFCEICETTIGNESVGFCKMCEKFMCLNCCKHHEKIPLLKNHVLLGKEEMKNARQQKKLFVRCFVPLQNYCIQCTSERCKPNLHYIYPLDNSPKLLGLARNIPGTAQSIGCFIQHSGNLYLKWTIKSFGNIENTSIIDRSSHAMAAESCLYDPKTLCFTKPSLKTIYIFTYSDARKTFIESVKINTSGQCYGIASFNNGLAISINIPTNYSLPEWQVQFISLNGSVRQQIFYDNEEKPLFNRPRHLTSNDAEDILFVSDQGNHSIIALDTKGYTLFKYTHETIQNPLGLTCDDGGNIYVASGNKVVQIDQHGTKSRVVLTSKETTQNVKLFDVCYNKLTNELGVLSETAVVTILKPLP